MLKDKRYTAEPESTTESEPMVEATPQSVDPPIGQQAYDLVKELDERVKKIEGSFLYPKWTKDYIDESKRLNRLIKNVVIIFFILIFIISVFFVIFSYLQLSQLVELFQEIENKNLIIADNLAAFDKLLTLTKRTINLYTALGFVGLLGLIFSVIISFFKKKI